MADLKLNFKANFDKAKDKANDYVKHLQKKMKAGGGGIGQSLLGGVVGGAVAGAAIAGATKAFQMIARAARAAVTHVKDTAVYMDNIAKASRRINWDVGDFQKVQYAVERTGGSFENIERAYKKFQSQYSRLFDKVPSAEVKGLFEKLGISKADMANLSSLERFMLVSRRLMQMEDPDLRAGVANRLFGQGGSKLLPAMQEMQPLVGRFMSEEFGFSKEALADSERAIDLLSDLARSIALLTAESGAIKLFADSVNYMVGITQSMRRSTADQNFGIEYNTSPDTTFKGSRLDRWSSWINDQIGTMIEGAGYKVDWSKIRPKKRAGNLDVDQSDDVAAKAMRLEKMASDQFLNVGRQLTSVGLGPVTKLDAISENTKRTYEVLELLLQQSDGSPTSRWENASVDYWSGEIEKLFDPKGVN